MFQIASRALVFGCQPQTFLCRLLYKWFENLVASVAVAVLVHIIFGWQWKHTHRDAYAPKMTTSTNNTQPSVIGFLWEFSVATMLGFIFNQNVCVVSLVHPSISVFSCLPVPMCSLLNFVFHILSAAPSQLNKRIIIRLDVFRTLFQKLM